MEKLTINRVGPEKVIEYTNKKTGKPDSFKKVGVQTNEYGERWFDVTFRGDVPVKVGQSYEFEISEREYTKKDGSIGKSYDAKLPKAGSVDFTRLATLENKVTSLTLSHNKLVNLLVGKGIIPAPVDTIPGTSVEYPKETAKEVDWNPKDAESVTFNGVDPEMESLMQSAEEAMS